MDFFRYPMWFMLSELSVRVDPEVTDSQADLVVNISLVSSNMVLGYTGSYIHDLVSFTG